MKKFGPLYDDGVRIFIISIGGIGLLIYLIINTTAKFFDDLAVMEKLQLEKQPKLISDSFLEDKFDQLTKRAFADSTITFRLDTLTTFSWDTLVIVQPYYPIDSLEKEAHAKLLLGCDQFLFSDNVNILAFIKGGQLINYVRLPRNKGDFWSIRGNLVLARDSCVFEFSRSLEMKKKKIKTE